MNTNHTTRIYNVIRWTLGAILTLGILVCEVEGASPTYLSVTLMEDSKAQKGLSTVAEMALYLLHNPGDWNPGPKSKACRFGNQVIPFLFLSIFLPKSLQPVWGVHGQSSRALEEAGQSLEVTKVAQIMGPSSGDQGHFTFR